jgi:hypothetical protein
VWHQVYCQSSVAVSPGSYLQPWASVRGAAGMVPELRMRLCCHQAVGQVAAMRQEDINPRQCIAACSSCVRRTLRPQALPVVT